MRPALDVHVPATWARLGSEYSIDGLEIGISDVQGLPDDPGEWLAAEFARRGAGAPTVTVVETDAGYPALVAEAAGEAGLMIVMYQLLELGAVAIVHGPRAAYDARRAEIREVLMAARPRWGVPVTIADLLAGTAAKL